MANYTAVPGDNLQAIVNALVAGDVLTISGTHTVALVVGVSGTATNRITIKGDGSARIQSPKGRTGGQYSLEVNGSYLLVADLIAEEAGKGVVVHGATHCKFQRVTVRYTRDEGFKTRNFSEYIYFDDCVARDTGLGLKFGEGFYTGDAATNWVNSSTPDRTRYIRYDNCQTYRTYGDGWDAKEGASDIVVKNCSVDHGQGNAPPAGNSTGDSGYYSRADRIQHIDCTVTASPGHGFKCYDTTANSIVYGRGQEVKGGSSTNQGGAGVASQSDDMAVYSDFTSTTPRIEEVGGGWHPERASLDPAGFTERTWSSPAAAYTTNEGTLTDPGGTTDTVTRDEFQALEARVTALEGDASAPDPQPDPDPDGWHTVQPGDTLSAIAARTGVTVDELADWNDIGDPNLISVGQVLRLTAPDPEPNPDPDPEPDPELDPDPDPEPEPGDRLYSTDFSDWSGVYTDSGRFQQTGRGNLALVDGAARARIAGSSSGTARAEVIPRFEALREGSEYWFGLRTRLSPRYPAGSSWQLIAQWKNDGTGSPPVQLAAQGGRYTLVGHNSGGGVAYRHDLGIAPGGPIRVGEWEKWAIRIRFSSSASSGLVEVWRNGEQVLAPTARPTLYSGRTSYAKVGYYRDEGIGADSWVEHDYYRIGTSRGAVS